MGHYNLVYKHIGEEAVLIEWPAEVNDIVLNDIKCFNQIINDQLASLVLETIPSYHSLLVILNNVAIENFIQKAQLHYVNCNERVLNQGTHWEIPVCYHQDVANDLLRLANEKKMNVETLIKIHSEVIYKVHFLGFLPGFLYLGGLPEVLHTPRKNQPELHVKKGAVAIGGAQTGIYPENSPGGWHIIGHSPITLFDPDVNPPTQIVTGDRVSFVPISLEDLRSNNYNLSKIEA